MGKDDDCKNRRRKSFDPSSSSSSSSSFSSESHEDKRKRPRRHSKSSRHREKKSKHQKREVDSIRSSRKRKKKRQRSLSSISRYNSSGDDSPELLNMAPEEVLNLILQKFPDVGHDLQHLLQLVDSGQGVDIKGISDKSFVRVLKKLFLSMNLKENRKGVFFLPSKAMPTLMLIGSPLCSHLKFTEDRSKIAGSLKQQQTSLCEESTENQQISAPDLTEHDKYESPVPHKRRIMGPEMPSNELLAAAAELTRAEAELREANLEVDDDLFIGPPPPAMVTEVESTNEAERFEEVTRIVFSELDKPYDVLGVNWKTSLDNIKKRYWKLSLMVHPDKCSHPQAHQAFVLLNQAFKDLQNPEKRKAFDEKIKVKEEQEAFQAELKTLREAAEWRHLQGISLEGDEVLLAFPKEEPKARRDEWMTELPPERKPGMPVQSTSFSKSSKEGRGNTKMWTDDPLEKSRRAKQNYLEAYNKAREAADADDRQKSRSSDADLVDKYESSKRSKSLVQKHREGREQPERRMKEAAKREEWKGMHPWRPWDRDKDLAAGSQKGAKVCTDGMAQGLASRFSSSSGSTQRNFL